MLDTSFKQEDKKRILFAHNFASFYSMNNLNTVLVQRLPLKQYTKWTY